MTKVTDMSRIIRERMEEHLNKKKLSFDGKVAGTSQATNIAIGNAFTEYYVREIAYFNDLTEEDKIDEGLDCDGPNDLNIDFIYEKPDVNEFWIFQSKYKGKKTGLSSDEIAGFFNIHEKILDHDRRAKANNTVKGLLERFTEKSSVNYVLLTNTKATENNQYEFNQLEKEKSARSKAENVQWILMDLSGIKSQYDEIDSRGNQLPDVQIPIIRRHIELPIEGKEHKEYKSIVMIVQGTTLHNLITEHREALFSYNIRGFLGNKGKNKQITKTLDEDSSLFYLYNNGISAICTEMNIEPNQKGEGGMALCKDFQIINGAQTVGSIRGFGRNGNNMQKLKKVNVLMRITKAEKVRGPTKGINRNMIKYNNSQNVIRDADFRSNDPVQEKLEAKFKAKEIWYSETSPKKIVYMPKRIWRPKKQEIQVHMDSLAKSLYAFKTKENTPAKINSLTGFLFDENAKDGYWSLFGDEQGEQTDVVTDGRFKEFAAVAILNHFLESKHKELKKKTEPDEIKGMVVRTGRLFLWAFGYAIRKFYPGSEGKIYEKIINGEAFSLKPGKEGFVHVWYNHINEKFHDILILEAYKDESDEDDDKKKTFNFKTWLRSNKKMKRLMHAIDHISDKGELPKI